MATNKLSLFPETAAITPNGHLAVAGCDVVELAHQFGTPLYLFDEEKRQLMLFASNHPSI